jgi:hypothetical protein
MNEKLAGAGLIVGVILLLVGLYAFNARGAEIERLNERIGDLEGDASNASEYASLLEEEIRTCQRAVRAAQEFAERAVESHLALYDAAASWSFEAYNQGLAGASPEEMNLGLGRTMAGVEERYRALEASEIGQYDYLGWAGGVMSARPNPARVCLGIEDE